MDDLANDNLAVMTDSIDFAIRLDFERNSEEPSRIFRTMTGLIEACETIDTDLAASISIKVTPVLVLQEIQAGSLTSRLTYILKSIDDEALAHLDWKKIVGAYLVKCKRRLVEYIEKRSTIEEASEIYTLQDVLGQAVDEAGLILISLNSPLPAPRVAEHLRLLSDATRPLIPGDTAQFVTDEGPVPINTSF
jgi:hypothetical protein